MGDCRGLQAREACGIHHAAARSQPFGSGRILLFRRGFDGNVHGHAGPTDTPCLVGASRARSGGRYPVISSKAGKHLMPTRSKLALISALLVCFVVGQAVRGDYVVLKDGTVLEGTVLK